MKSRETAFKAWMRAYKKRYTLSIGRGVMEHIHDAYLEGVHRGREEVLFNVLSETERQYVIEREVKDEFRKSRGKSRRKVTDDS